MSMLDEQALEYMHQWIDQEYWSMDQIFYNNKEVSAWSDYLVSAGAIDSKVCFDNAKEIERYIEKQAQKFKKLSFKKQNKIISDLLENVLVIECKECNHTSFVSDNNEDLYPEVLKKCWSCSSIKLKIERN